MNDSSAALQINQRLEFPTTIEKNAEQGGYKSKSVQLQVQATGQDGRIYQSSTELELADFVGSEPLTRKLRLLGEPSNVEVDLTCCCSLPEVSQLQKFKSMANLQTGPSELEEISRSEQKPEEQLQPEKSQKPLGLAPRTKRKEKTLHFIPEAAEEQSKVVLKEFNTVAGDSEVKRTLKRAMTTFNGSRPFSFGGEEPINQQQAPKAFQQVQQEAPTTLKQLPREHSAETKKIGTSVSIADPKPTAKKEALPSINNLASATSIECKQIHQAIDDSELREAKETIRKLRDELKQLEKESKEHKQTNTKLTRQLKEQADKIEAIESTEKNSEEGKQRIVKRLYEDIDGKNRQLKALEAEAEQLLSRLKSEGEESLKLKRELNEMRLERDKLAFEVRQKTVDPLLQTKEDKRHKKELDRLKQEYEQEIKDLKSQLKQVAAIPETASPNNQICLSHACEQLKKDLKLQLKTQLKTIEEKDKQLQTKERLIKNYESIKKDRQTESSSISLSKELEKWRAQRLLLEQQIEDLQSARNETIHKRPNDELLTYKVEKENLAKELDRTRRNLNQLTKEKDSLEVGSKEKEEAIIKAKQKIVDLLNAIQQHGGMDLYETICNLIQ